VILGILSDTHGQAQRTASAVRLLHRLGAEALIHCGDVGGEDVLEQLAGQRAWIVCGNTDCPDEALVHYAESLGLVVTHAGPLRLELDGRALAVFHGHEARFVRLVNRVLDTGAIPADFGRCDYVLHGHTHVARDERLGPLRVINPGALQRAPVHTVATLDLRADRVEFWRVDDARGDAAPVAFRP
jgi:putative phosphoesterase